ncbi:hypothetical protein [Pedobacter paludis]|uniref:Uncharacterized protein n=1 Tax=Pedobacter paludis TaxID=2203212 RepID=A0A317F2B3_9SPHI|nr:hypothetical protein [Pedobacter paludis]PWS31969.1 hypothetical protein DF947_09270 [Pedobacter paludis]
MMNKENKISADLQRFIEKFEPNKYKTLARGIEIRGINDIHRSITLAENLIEKMKLKLTINHNAEMVSYGGFEVNNLA